MRKRILSIICLAALVLGSVACGNGESSQVHGDVDESKATHLHLALRDGIYADAIVSCLPDFEEKYNVWCEVERLSEDDLHSFVMDDAGNTQGKYDLCMVDGSWMAEYTEKGVLADLSEFGYELDDDIIPATKEVCYHDDHLYLAPYYGNVTVLLYNKKLFQKAGYEGEDVNSLADLMEICEYSAQHGNLGFMYRGDSENNYVVDFLPILLSYGGWVVDEDNNPTVDTPEFHDAMEFYQRLIGTGAPVSRDDLVMAIANQAATVAIGWPGWYTPTAESTANYTALSGRKDNLSASFNANVYGVWTIGVTANSPQLDLTERLLEHLMDPRVQRDTIDVGGVPCRYSSLQDPKVLAVYPQYEAVCKALERGVYRPIMAEWKDFYTILGAEMKLMLTGEKSIDQGLVDAQQELEEMLGTSGK